MITLQPKKDKSKIIVSIDIWRIPTGHRQMPKSGPHKDRRRLARVNSKVRFKESQGG
jgi:hypothetical protein